MENLISILFSLNGVIVVASYAPQVFKLSRAHDAVKNFSFPSWTLWLWSSFVGFIYSITIVSDILLIIISGLGFLGNLLIWFLILIKRNQYKNSNTIPHY